jgi:hypothetical protein
MTISAFILVAIGGYLWLFYLWLLTIALLMTINGYWWLFYL